jgi:phage-related tail fiber protein
MSNHSVLTGMIVAFYGSDINQLPNDYYVADGSVITTQNDPGLYAFLTAANPALTIDAAHCHLPDLRGEFLRGLDIGRGVDPGRTIGSWEADAFKAHTHSLGRTDQGPAGHSGIFVNWTSMSEPADKGYVAALSTDGGTETRPRNVAVTYLIAR